jgi:hypothetical protein
LSGRDELVDGHVRCPLTVWRGVLGPQQCPFVWEVSGDPSAEEIAAAYEQLAGHVRRAHAEAPTSVPLRFRPHGMKLRGSQ